MVWESHLDPCGGGGAAPPLEEDVDASCQTEGSTCGEPPARNLYSRDILAERLENVNIGSSSEKENVNRVEKENVQEKSDDEVGSAAVLRELKEMSKKLDTVTNTVILMEKRISLVEEQVRILSRSKQ